MVLVRKAGYHMTIWICGPGYSCQVLVRILTCRWLHQALFAKTLTRTRKSCVYCIFNHYQSMYVRVLFIFEICVVAQFVPAFPCNEDIRIPIMRSKEETTPRFQRTRALLHEPESVRKPPLSPWGILNWGVGGTTEKHICRRKVLEKM